MDLFGTPTHETGALSPEPLYQIAFPASAETRRLLLRAKDLLRHKFPKAETEAIVKFALEKLVAEIDRDLRKPKPRRSSRRGARSRHIPEAVKRQAWERDGGQCAYIAPDGTRCTAKAWLEFDHKVPFAVGGSSSDCANIRLYCRPHNQWAAREVFGDRNQTRNGGESKQPGSQ